MSMGVHVYRDGAEGRSDVGKAVWAWVSRKSRERHAAAMRACFVAIKWEAATNKRDKEVRSGRNKRVFVCMDVRVHCVCRCWCGGL